MSATSSKASTLTAVDRTVVAIRDGIRSGIYSAGQRLVETELVNEMGVSRGPLREAMWRLAGEGLVTIEPNRGVIVSRITHEGLQEIYEIRELLEGLAARGAADQIDIRDHRARLKKINDEAIKADKQKDVEKYTQVNEDFHHTVAEICGNQRLQGLLDQLRLPLYRLQFKSMLSPGNSSKSNDEHQDIYEAIMSGDGSKAERAMRKHVRASGKLLQKLLERSGK